MAQTTSREEIAANVRAAMAYRRVEQAEIATVIGKSRTATSTRVNGQSNFRINELQAIAAHLEIPLEQLLAPAAQEATA